MACLRTSTYCLLSLGVLLGCPSKSQDGDTEVAATDTTATTTNTTADKPTSTAATDTAATDTAATDTAATTFGPLEPSGPNPCGSCAPGEYCRYTPSDNEFCEWIACYADDSEMCMACIAAPTECEPGLLAECAAWRCSDSELLGVSVAEDGVLVIHCDIYADTGCGS